MAGEWRRHEVSDLLNAGKLVIGDGYRAKNEELASNGLPFARAGNINDGFRFEDADHFPEQNLARVGNKISQPGDVVFTSKGTVGRFAFVRSETKRFVYSPQLCFWRSLDREKIDPRFLYYWMYGREFFIQFKGVAGQTDMAEYVSLTDQRRMHITLPDVDEQRAIAHILGTLDDKIELNRRMNETLEAMARALFKSWFVDFGPVRAKAERRDPGLPKPLADIFPDSFEDSELGEIPKGWNVKPLRDLTCYLSRGIGPSYVEEGGICVLNQKCIRDRRVNFAQSRRHDSIKRSIEGRELRTLDILVNSTGVGTLGRIAQLWHLPETAIVDSHVTIVRAANDVDPWFLGVGLLRREADIEELGEGSTGQTELSRVRLGSLSCLVPPTNLQRSFGQIASHLLRRIADGDRESITLAALRDTLLPKLISGELRIRVEQPARATG